MIQKPAPAATINRSHSLARGLTGSWLFNERGGAIAYDGAGLNNGVITTGERTGRGLLYDGATTNVDTSFDGSGNNEITIIARIKPSGSDRRYIIDNSPGSSGFIFRLDGDSLSAYVYAESSSVLASKTSSVTNGQWHTVAFTFSNRYVKIYVDGVLLDISSQAAGDTITASTDTMRIGSEFDGTDCFEGVFEYCYAYNRALTLSDILQLHQNPYAIYERPRRMHATIPAADSSDFKAWFLNNVQVINND